MVQTSVMDRPGEITPATLAPRLADLPTHEMAWESFELLLRRMAREIRGLRQVQLYGARGQAQYGIDIVGRNADDMGEAIQSKKYIEFTKKDLTDAVTKFLDERSKLPFEVERLIVAAGCHVDRTEIINELYRFNREHHGLEIELWDRRSIGDELRGRRDLVTEFFGDTTAELFCYPGPPHVVLAPPADRIGMADALMRGPAAAVGADRHLDEAARLEAEDPRGAAQELQHAEALLAGGSFGAHAAVLTRRRAELLAAAGDHAEAATLLSRRFWHALDNYDRDEAEGVAQSLHRVGEAAGGLAVDAIAQAAIQVVRHPIGLPSVEFAGTWTEQAPNEVARLALLTAETAAIDFESPWRGENADLLNRCADAVSGAGPEAEELIHRIRTEIADATGDWTELLDRARRRRVARGTAALILARYAMHNAERGAFAAADESWEEAIEQACLDGRNNAAAEWVHSRRNLHSRHRGLAADLDDFPNLVKSLWQAGDATGPSPAQRIEVRALQAIAQDKPHVAAPRLRAWLRFAHSQGYWGEVNYVQTLLANTYRHADEPDHAATLLISAGQASAAEELAKEVGDRYLDVRPWLTAPAYWASASAFRLLAAQADLVPDHDVDEMVDSALEALTNVRTGQLQDTPFFSPSLALAALKTASALAGRLTVERAARLLDYLRPHVPRGKNRYRHTDDDHVRACVAIATAHASLREEAVGQLLGLLAEPTSGVAQKVEEEAGDLVTRHPDLVRDRLTELAAQDNRFAGSLLALITDEPSEAQLADARAAAEQLKAPSRNTAEVVSVGIGAVRQSLLARHLPPDERAVLVQAQLDRAASPYEPGSNRADYYLAAANLSTDLEDVEGLFAEALVRAGDPKPSHADLVVDLGNHPLGMYRTTGTITDTRPYAVLLAAALARTEEQKIRVRTSALGLLGSGQNSVYHAVRALQILGVEKLLQHVTLLAVHQDWATRCLAAVTWPRSAPTDATVGLLLARDPDQRVRRSLAGALREHHSEPAERVREVLRADPRHSVRRLLDQPSA
ncbi:hypothetical protein [Nocardia sp. NRRL S-836]|uniref:hypothetical protein n=1 Tax=Nocardia sp. NRRL S-836 TaxID=1519492 RepID=UPI0006AED984|nr:hypothetical protein [Nocardia sp. NRRL S-836]KOV84629.1 hypothetical protein ADL03_15140 [Nocardia sp. NRRL S-836]